MKRLPEIPTVKWMLALGMALALSSSLMAQEPGLTVIGNKASVPSEMTFEQLRTMLLGEKMRWNDGKPVIIAIMKTNTPLGQQTSSRIYNMNGNELNKYFLALVFQGRVKAPNFFDIVSDLESFVARTPGAIGVVGEPKDPSLKIISIDGKSQL